MSGEKMETTSQTYIPGPDAIDISPDQNKGVLKEILVPGTGDETPHKGNKVSVHYTGKLLDGTKFDSSVDRGQLFEFNLGLGEVIKAWDIGVATMRKGEKCILYCKPEFAYGEKGSPPKIPANATLIFEVELFNWDLTDLSPDKNKTILRSLISEGEGYATPGDGATVEVKLVGKCGGNIFEERELKFEIGCGIDSGVVEGIEIAVKQFKKGEKSRIILDPVYAYGSDGNKELNIPPDSSVEYEVTLINFEKEKESWNMTSEEKLEQSEIVKNKGTTYFKKGQIESNGCKWYQAAIQLFKRIVGYLQLESELEGENLEKRNSLLIAGYLNLAACFLKLKKYDEVIENCDKALEIDPKNVKGHFRKGQAFLALNDFELAKVCFTKVLEIEPSNKAAQKNILVCKEFLKKQLMKEKQMYQSIFKKMALEKDPEEPKDEALTQENGVKETEGAEAIQA